ARQRCWRYDWVLDIDVKGYFDSIDWELMLKAVRRHTDCAWVLRTLAEGASADGGRRCCAAPGGNSSGRGRKPHPGESVSALCVRYVDGENLSSHPVRARRG